MIFWILAALLTAAALGIIIGPLRRDHKRLALALTIIVPLVALGIYLLTGNPELTQ